MPAKGHRYAIHVMREDGTSVAQVPVEVDWEPVREWVRLLALGRGRVPAEAFQLECIIEPAWHRSRARPYLEGFTAWPVDEPRAETATSFSFLYLSERARGAATQLVADGKLQEGERFLWLPVAFPRDTNDDEAARPDCAARFRSVAPEIEPRRTALGPMLERATPSERGADDAPLHVFVPRRVLGEVSTLGHDATPHETGGILIGHLHRDPDASRLFLEVTAHIPAHHTEADATHLAFTPDTWTQVRAGLELRARHEIMVGWWHSHPVREWCKQCTLEKQRECPFARGFLSQHDKTLHRTVFPRGFSVALLVNDVAFSSPTYSLFGWRHGMIERRAFHTLGPQPRQLAAEAHEAGDQP